MGESSGLLASVRCPGFFWRGYEENDKNLRMQEIIKEDSRVDQSTYWIVLVIVLSVFSQIESIDRIVRPLMYLSWMAALGLLIVRNGFSFWFSKSTLIYLALFSIFSALQVLVYGFQQTHMKGNYFRILRIPLLVSLVAELYKASCREKDFQLIVKVYILCSLVYALWVNLTYFPSYTAWLSQRIYTFELKNSAAQIWSAAIFLLLFAVDYKSVYTRWIGYGLSVYLLIISALSQCRTALLALVAAAGWIILCYSNKKMTFLVCGLVLFLVIWNIPLTRGFIEQAFFLNKYEGADLNTFSSGRLYYWERALVEFSNHPIVGTGKYYVDCAYILVLAETGLTGFFLIEPIWFSRIMTNLRYEGKTNLRILLSGMTAFYLVTSALEGYPPFGPGVSSFMFWFVSVLLTGDSDFSLEREDV